MSYIDSNLMRGETVVYKAEIHWFIFLPGIVVAAIGFLMMAAGGEAGVFGALALLVGVALILKAAITKVTTELAVTSKRGDRQGGSDPAQHHGAEPLQGGEPERQSGHLRAHIRLRHRGGETAPAVARRRCPASTIPWSSAATPCRPSTTSSPRWRPPDRRSPAPCRPRRGARGAARGPANPAPGTLCGAPWDSRIRGPSSLVTAASPERSPPAVPGRRTGFQSVGFLEKEGSARLSFILRGAVRRRRPGRDMSRFLAAPGGIRISRVLESAY